MNCEEVYGYFMSLPETVETFPFDEVTLVFKVRDKMFGLLPLDDPEWIILKCDPERAVALRNEWDGIRPAYHFNKRHWNMVRLDGSVPPQLVRSLIAHSYNCVLVSMTRRNRDGLSAVSEDYTDEH